MLSDHPARSRLWTPVESARLLKPEIVVLLALRHEGSEHRESIEDSDPVGRNLCLDLSSFTSTLTKNASASPLDSALTLKRPPKSFTSNTYKKHTGGGGGPPLSVGRRNSAARVLPAVRIVPAQRATAIACRNRCAYNGLSAVDGAPFANRMARRTRHQHKIRDAHRKAGTEKWQRLRGISRTQAT